MPPATTTAPPAEPAAPMAKPMPHHQFIESVQTALNANGAQVTVDGRMGPKTGSALRAFQQKHNLKVTGRPDQATVQALGIHQ
jgi:peptidoglycan hydrolase-like protein with peptidoglycan-binding domain